MAAKTVLQTRCLTLLCTPSSIIRGSRLGGTRWRRGGVLWSSTWVEMCQDYRPYLLYSTLVSRNGHSLLTTNQLACGPDQFCHDSRRVRLSRACLCKEVSQSFGQAIQNSHKSWILLAIDSRFTQHICPQSNQHFTSQATPCQSQLRHFSVRVSARIMLF